ncbi:MAG TPA: kelch repeat-containing protein [Thermoanaerobaculia bacterium]|nr:kelch repeat-containing protein [Thermoanaerobaculia bacterium]
MRSRSKQQRRRVAQPSAFLATLFLLTLALPAAAAEQWLPGPGLSIGRNYFALVPLPSGDLLAPGGVIAVPGYTNRVDIFSITGRSFSETTAMPVSHRNQYQAVRLGNGKILIAGEQYDGVSEESHLFTESTHSWSATVNQPALNRFAAAMALLPNGTVLYAGGYNGGGTGPTYDSAELFDPATSTWSPTGAMVALRWGLILTPLVTGPNAGKILVTGGGQRIGLTVEARCELYDPATGTFALTGSLNQGRAFHTATRLLDGRVLVTGGHDTGFGSNHDTAEIYDPMTGAWSFAPSMATRRARHTATLLPNGDVLVVGGAQVGTLDSVTATAEIYHPATNSWRAVPAMSMARVGHAAALLPGGEVLVAGGYDGANYLAASEIFQSGLSNPPTAAAGPDQTVRSGSPVHLDGSASSDDVTPGPSLGFSWTLTSRPAGSAAVLSGDATATPSFLADRPGTYTAQLVVTDEDGQASNPDQITISSNVAPAAAAQASSTQVKVGTPIALDAAGSADPENDPLTYQWTLSKAPPGSAAVITNAGTAQATLVPDVPGDYEVTLTVSDFLGAGAPASLTITVAPVPILEVPVLSQEGALLLAMLLMIAALSVLRRAG